MMAILAALSIFLLGVLVFGGCVLVVRRFVNFSVLQPNNETVSHYLGIIIGIYGIFSGFVIVSLWEQQRQAEETVLHEANELRTVFRLAGTLSDDTRQQIRGELLRYAERVLNTEWQRLIDGDPTLHSDHPEKDRIWKQIVAYRPNAAESVFFEALVSHYETLSEYRRDRCYDAQRNLPPYLWMILALGSILSIGCTLFIGTENIRTQASLTGISGGLLLLLLFVVYDLQNPFQGHWTVSPQAFEFALKRMKESTVKDAPGRALQAGGGAEVHP